MYARTWLKMGTSQSSLGSAPPFSIFKLGYNEISGQILSTYI